VCAKLISVEVIYAKPHEQKILSLQVEEGATLEKVIEMSGILQLYPEIDLTQQKIGVFSRLKKLSDLVQAGDRIEIYRPLLIDPKEARRKRASKKRS